MKSIIEGLKGIKLGEPCQLFKSNEKNKKLCTKVDYFLLGNKLSWATANFLRFFFSFRPFSSIKGSHSVLSFSKQFCFQCPSPSHQLPPYLLSLHLKIFSLFSLFPGNSISIIFLSTSSWSLLMTCAYHLSMPSLIFIPNRSTLTVPLMYSFLILSFLVTPIANLNIFISATSTLPLVSL